MRDEIVAGRQGWDLASVGNLYSVEAVYHSYTWDSATSHCHTTAIAVCHSTSRALAPILRQTALSLTDNTREQLRRCSILTRFAPPNPRSKVWAMGCSACWPSA